MPRRTKVKTGSPVGTARPITPTGQETRLGTFGTKPIRFTVYEVPGEDDGPEYRVYGDDGVGPRLVRVHVVNAAPGALWVAVLTDVGTEKVDAIWCGQWECRSAAWKAQCAALTFRTYLNDQPTIRQRPTFGRAR